MMNRTTQHRKKGRPKNPSSSIRLTDISFWISTYLEVSHDEVLSKNRKPELAKARMFVCVISRDLGHSTSQIAKHLKYNDHTAVVSSCKRSFEYIRNHNYYRIEMNMALKFVKEKIERK